MARLPNEPTPTVKAIYESYERANKPRMQRRLGAASIGHACHRKTFYDFRWAMNADGGHDGRLLRLFDTGHKEELRFVSDLRAIGCEVLEVDPTTKEQWTFTACDGHFVSKIDAAVRGLPEAPKAWHVAEFKTHSEKSFNELVKKGVRDAKPEHYAQVLAGMHLSGMERGLYLAVNKNTDDLYAERFHYVKAEGDALMAFAASIVKAKDAPPRAFDNSDKFPCSFCTHRQICWPSIPPHPAVGCKATCRNCVHSSAVEGGFWKCERHGVSLSEDEQAKGCDDHLFLPSFLAFAEVEGSDTASNSISYKTRDGTKFTNGQRPGDYKSIELTVLPHPMIASEPLVDALKLALDGSVIAVED